MASKGEDVRYGVANTSLGCFGRDLFALKLFIGK
jgi:hypothetical protein